MPSLKVLAAAMALAAAGIQATEIELPPCLEPFRPYVYSGCFKDLGSPSILQWRTPLDQQAMTHEKCMAACKGNGFRYAGLTYYGVCYCGQTVKGPQVDESQCNYPCTGDSAQTCGGNNVFSVFTDPTFTPIDEVTIADYDHLGCWTDDSRMGRALTYRMDIDGSTLTTEKCLTACRAEGYPFAGTEFGGECYCGNVIANDTRAAPETECTSRCNGDVTQSCGGPGRLNLYVADELKSLEPCGYEPPVVSSSSSSPVIPSSAPPSSAPVSSSPPATSEPTTVHTSSEPVISTPPPTVTTPSSTKSSTKTPTPTKSLCVTTTTAPSTCEYKCGNWCSNPLPNWNDLASCKAAYSNCKLQQSSCFHTAGWPGSLFCFEFATWCSSLERYCSTASHGGSKPSYCKGSPPKNPSPPTTITITTTCAPTATPTPTKIPTVSSTTKCPIPTATNLCKQPTNRRYDYAPGNPVGGIDLPILTCNDLSSDHPRNPFKLYTSPDTRNCRSFPRPQTPSACAAACKEQYDDCMAVYAETCRRGGGRHKARAVVGERTIVFGEDYETAAKRCKAQYADCLEVNKGVTGQGKCTKFGSGPW